MESTEKRQLDGGWIERLLLAAGVAAVGLVGLGASCEAPGTTERDAVEPDGGAVTDVASSRCRSVSGAETCRERGSCQWLTATCEGGRVIGGCFAGSGWRDASLECPADRDVAAGDVDAGPEGCDAAGSESECRGRGACRWWTAYCGGQLVEARCIDRETTPESPRCAAADGGGSSSDAGLSDTSGAGDTSTASDASADAADLDADAYCRMHSNESDCQSDTRCKWWVDSCDGYLIEERCVAQHTTPSSTSCKQIPREECHEVDSESGCQPPNCEWVAEGCGSGPTGAREVTACLPEGRCKTDADCPANHRCTTLWTDVCHGSACQACGGETSRCVPQTLLNP